MFSSFLTILNIICFKCCFMLVQTNIFLCVFPLEIGAGKREVVLMGLLGDWNLGSQHTLFFAALLYVYIGCSYPPLLKHSSATRVLAFLVRWDAFPLFYNMVQIRFSFALVY